MDNFDRDYYLMVGETILRQIIKEEIAKYNADNYGNEACPYLGSIPTRYECLSCPRIPRCMYEEMNDNSI